jgi:hypothetical protein
MGVRRKWFLLLLGISVVVSALGGQSLRQGAMRK